MTTEKIIKLLITSARKGHVRQISQNGNEFKYQNFSTFLLHVEFE